MTVQAENAVSVATNEIKSRIGTTKLKAIKAKKPHALRIVRRYMLLAGGVGLIPAPFLDQMVIGGLLAKMFYDLCDLYGVKVAEHKVKAAIAAVLGGTHSEWITRYSLHYIKRYLPGFNTVGHIVTRPVIAAATTYAVGMLFVHHFDKGVWLGKASIGEPGPESLPSP